MIRVAEWHIYVDQTLVQIKDDGYDACEYAEQLKRQHGDGTPVQVVLVSEEERLLTAKQWAARPLAVHPDQAVRELAAVLPFSGHSVRV